MIAFVQSPFQVFGVFEYPVECQKIYVRFSDEQNDIQILNVIGFLELDAKIVVLRNPDSIKRILRWFACFLAINFTFDRPLFGGSDSKLKYFVPRRIELDDGLYSLKLIRELKDKRLFSFFKMDPKFSHRFDRLRSIINSHDCKWVQGGDYLIGQPFVEANHCSQEEYVRVISEIKANNPNINTYIAHRTERNDKLEAIRMQGLVLIRPDLPLELFFLKNSITPNRVYGFNSTSLITLKILYQTFVIGIDWQSLLRTSRRPVDFIFARGYILERSDEVLWVE